MRLFILIFFFFSFQLFPLSRVYLDRLQWKMKEKDIYQLERRSKYIPNKVMKDQDVDGYSAFIVYLKFKKRVFNSGVTLTYCYDRKNKRVLNLSFYILQGKNYISKFNKKFYGVAKKISSLVGAPYAKLTSTLNKKYQWKYGDKRITLFFEEKAYTYDCKIYLEITPYK